MAARDLALLLLTAVSVAAATRYPVTGVVLKVDPLHRSFEASCGAIPGYMDAMAMAYSVLDNRELADLKPGAYVDFTLVVEKKRSYAERIRIHHYESTEREPLLARRLKMLEAPHATVQPGDTVPLFTLIDQTGSRVTLSQWAGKVVAVTFIYTSCPLPDYCFRLANNFSQLNQRFAARMGRDLVLLSISFDPVHDQPAVLAKYASTWKADPESWHFLTGPLDDVKAVSRQFGLNFSPAATSRNTRSTKLKKFSRSNAFSSGVIVPPMTNTKEADECGWWARIHSSSARPPMCGICRSEKITSY